MIWWFLYSFIGGMYYKHNDTMGDWFTGLILSLLWPIAAGMWIYGYLTEKLDERELRKFL